VVKKLGFSGVSTDDMARQHFGGKSNSQGFLPTDRKTSPNSKKVGMVSVEHIAVKKPNL
jgi:hypothetical protein